MEHFIPDISKEIEQYATETVFKLSRYIFTWREGKQQYGYCTNCHNEFKTKLIHNDKFECPFCKSLCTVKSSGRGRKHLVDDAYFLYYEKSAKNPQAIVARGILAVRDYSGDYRRVKTQYLETARYIFEMGNSIMFTRYGYYSAEKTMKTWEDWQKRAGIFSMFNQTYVQRIRFHHTSYESVKAAIKGTPFQYSTIEEYFNFPTELFFNLYSKYPCIEYLTKLGFQGLIRDKLNGYATYGAINWRGNTLLKVLKLTKKDLKEIKKANIDLDPLTLCLYQISQKDGSNLNFDEITEIAKKLYFTKNFRMILKHTSLRQADKYINQQLKLSKQQREKEKAQKNGHYRHVFYNQSDVARYWLDYYADCQKLQMDITKKNVLFPRDLYKAHQNTIKQVKIHGNKLLDEKVKARSGHINTKYGFTKYGLIIRAAANTKELINEGRSLNHCVGTYADRYAAGKTTIMFIRKKENPDKPYYTVEIVKDTVIQVRGLNNCQPDKKVTKFIEDFKNAKLKADTQEVAVRIRVPA